MDEEMEIIHDLVAPDDDVSSFSDDFDSEYEFDAYHFFDFVRGETQSEAEEAESWFRFAHEYPPSPFIVKLKLMKAGKADPMKIDKTSSKKTEANKAAASKEMKVKGVKHQNHIPQDNIKAKSKSTVNLSKPSGSSFMKPTASHLAKQNKECDIHSGGYGRLQKPLVSAVEKLRSPIRFQNQTTKRQKLEIGYLRKTAQLKHRASFLHKVSKKAIQLEGSSSSRVKTTIPKKPTLVTEERAPRRMSWSKSEPVQQQKANTHASKPRPMNKNVLDTHSNKDKRGSPNNLKSCNSDKVHPVKDGGFTLNAKQDPHLPPIELFKKLSLKPESEMKVKSSSKSPHLPKGQKENVPRSYEQDFRRCAGKPNHCGPGRRITAVKYSPTLTGA